MRKKLSLFLEILLSFTFIFSVFGNVELAKAATFTGHYNDVLIGTSNLNNTANNSAKIGDKLLSPEIGWKRYDDTNSNIQYVGTKYWAHDIYGDNSSGYYKNTCSSYDYAYNNGNPGIVRFTLDAQKIRVIGKTRSSLPAIVYSDNIKIGEVAARGNDGGSEALLVFEYDFSTRAKRNIEIRIPNESINGSTHFSMLYLDAIDIDSNGDILGTKTISQEFIEKVYTETLGREPNQGDLEYWSNELNYNGAAKIVETFMFGQEALNKNYTNVQYVNILYRVMYGRDADTTGLNYWVGRLNEGYPRRTLIAAFSYEQEFKNMCLKYNVSSTPLILTAVTDIYGEATAYVTRLFRGLLNRDPDSGALNYYVQKLGVDKVKGRDVLKEIMNSSEFKNATVKNEDFVTRVYKGILLREPDSEGYSYWTNFLNNGGSRDEMINQFLNSTEYKNISNKYTITY